MLNLLKKVDNILKKIEEYFLALSMITISFLIVFNVILRYVFRSGWAASNELSVIIVVISTFIGSSYAARKGSHLSMSAIYDVKFIDKKYKKFFMILTSFVIAITSFILAYYGLQYVRSNIISGRTTYVLNFKLYYINFFFPLGFFMMGIQYLKNAYINLKSDKLYHGPEEEEGGGF